VVNNEVRKQRLRLLIRRFNKQRKQQAKQIDILCNDIILAHKDFLKAIKVIGFAANFYSATIGITDLNELLCAAGSFIQRHTPGAHVAFFLSSQSNTDGVQADNFEMHVFESEQELDLEEKRVENFFTNELVANISKSSQICTIDDMLGLGLQCSPAALEKISAAAIPISTTGGSLGFILIYRSSRNPLSADELKAVAQITPGLARSIAMCRSFVSSV
jgi:hypothetical protein